MSATDPVLQAVAEVLGCERVTDRNGTDYCVEHNFGWLRDVDSCPRAERAAEVAVAAARPAIEREAKAEAERLRHLLGSHADGHLCTCEMIDPGVYHGENMHPPEWEQDPWCPTHPDVNYIKTEVAARLAAVEALAEGPTSDGYRPYAVIIGTETHFAVLLDDLRAALATGATTNQQEADQ